MSGLAHAEVQMNAQVQGKANLIDVVTAITSAQTSLQTMMAVRDQMIAATSRSWPMPIDAGFEVRLLFGSGSERTSNPKKHTRYLYLLVS